MTGSHDEEDVWAAARERSRADVRAAFAPRRTTCPACGAAAEADGRRCPACGEPLVATRPKWRPSRRAVLTGTAVGAVAAAAVLTGVATLRDDAGRERRSAAERQRAIVAAEVARLTKDGLPRRVAGPRPVGAAGATAAATLAYRGRLVAAGERAITADAHRRGEDEVRGTTCQPTPFGPTRTAQERDPGVARNRYECIAYEHRFALTKLQGKARTGVFGTPYWLVADYRTGGLTLCKMTPKGGEAARTLANVTVDPACRDPFKRQSQPAS